MIDKKVSEIKKEKDELIKQIETLVNEFLLKNTDVAINIHISPSIIDTPSRLGNQTIIGGVNIESTLTII